ncbi:hypothetical protein [Microbulbifer epialgicus]|uniref:Uncharacterized protein n=1 Tax=Microbulbifer epialgicus TaxID=393907 RepID=A0ABV4NYH5_9GAMM
MRVFARLKLPLFAMACAGCVAQQVSAELEPALLIEKNSRVHNEVQRIVSEAMGGIEIHINPEVFAESSLLVLDKTPRQMGLIGRDMGRPIKFKLLFDGSTCWVMRLPDGPRWKLEALCSPAIQN